MGSHPLSRRTGRAVVLALYRCAFMAAGAVVVTIEAAKLTSAGALGPEPALFVLYAALLLAAETRSLPWLSRHDGGEVTASGTFAFALVLVAPAGSGLIAIAAASMFADLLHRKEAARVGFNAGQVVVSFWLGVIVLRTLTDPLMVMSGNPTTRWVIAAVAACAVTFTSNTLFAGGALSLRNDRPLLMVLRSALEPGMLIDGLLLGLSPVVVAVARLSLVLEPLLLVAVWSIYRNAATVITSRQEATHDLLTGLPNRRLFFEQADAALARARRKGRKAAVMHVDLNGFKAINDGLGHHVGDLLLREVANRLQGPRRSTDFVARLGGDEFAILLPRVEDAAAAERVAAKFRAAIGGRLEVNGVPIIVGASLGIALFPEHGDDVDVLLRNADAAMYRAKRDPSGVQLYRGSPRDRSSTRMDLLADLGLAITRGELVTVFQPMADLVTGEITHVEALVRWNHPRLGLIMPEQFIAAAEQTELVGALTERVLALALKQRAAWHAAGIDLVIGVNASVRNLHDLQFADKVARMLAETGTPPDRLEIEITENCMAVDPVRTEAVLTDLHNLGVGIALDDFGTGFSSLESLRSLPIDRVKIDRSFVLGLLDAGDDLTIVRSVIELAHDLGLRAVAEGVEDTDTLDVLKTLRCDVAQGFVIARPADARALRPLLELGTINLLPTSIVRLLPVPVPDGPEDASPGTSLAGSAVLDQA